MHTQHTPAKSRGPVHHRATPALERIQTPLDRVQLAGRCGVGAAAASEVRGSNPSRGGLAHAVVTRPALPDSYQQQAAFDRHNY